ncbi:hypothetical protein SCLCIDRAFT_179192 [Scleroderma citrinum Foug A]|uniref:Sec20 C-terminal domain-containing protein n=1 Tax=Scleroderma citrinum Foug A TaxID=1036808 RepID=A0A0C3EG44_9AGAM|nr:hypothetical protein SCLCIDRAFT_179192 [Scleroderma citrinum Foug A]
MPPLPAVFDADSLALAETIERGLNDLSTFQIPRLRTCTGPLATQQLWAAEIREDVEKLGAQIEELDVLVDDQRTERARRELRLRVDTFRDTLNELRKDSRAAVLASKRAIDAQQRSQREELLSKPPPINEKVLSTAGNTKATEDALMTATNNVTETLQRTMGLMQKELERSVLSSQLLETSTATLQSTSQHHDSLSILLGSSRELITALQKTDTLDRLLIADLAEGFQNRILVDQVREPAELEFRAKRSRDHGEGNSSRKHGSCECCIFVLRCHRSFSDTYCDRVQFVRPRSHY